MEDVDEDPSVKDGDEPFEVAAGRQESPKAVSSKSGFSKLRFQLIFFLIGQKSWKSKEKKKMFSAATRKWLMKQFVLRKEFWGREREKRDHDAPPATTVQLFYTLFNC